MARKFFALENEDLEVVDGTELSAQDVIEAADAEQEAEVDAAEVDELATAIEDAEVAADNLEDVAEVLEEGVESGEGVSEETAQAAEIAVEACLNMLGTSHRESSIMPSLESWGSGHSRLSATKIALEGITDTVKKIWERIVKFVKDIWQKVSDFFVKFFDNTDRLIKNATKLKQEIANKKDYKVKEKEIDNKGASKNFNAGQGNADGKTVIEVVKTHSAIARGSKGLISGITGTFNAVKDMINGNDGVQEGIGSKLEDMVRAAVSAIGQVETTSVQNVTYISLKGTLAGGKKMSFTVDYYNTPSVPAISGPVKKKAPKLGYVVTEVKKPAEKKAKTLTPDEASQVIESVIELGKATASFKEAQASMKEIVNTTSKIADAVLKSVDEHGSQTEARTWVTSTSNSISRFVTMTPAWNVAVGNAALNYVKSSVSAWEAK